MKKELLLLTCVLFSQAVYAADTGVERLSEFTVVIEQRASEGGTQEYVRIREQGEDIVVFPGEILQQSETVKNMLTDCSHENLLEEIVTLLISEHAHVLVKDGYEGDDEQSDEEEGFGREQDNEGKFELISTKLTSERIKLLINVLCHNEHEDDAQKFVEDLDKDDLVWLAHKAIFWEIGNIKAACEKRLVTEVGHLKSEELQDPYLSQRIIEQAISNANLNWKISKKLFHTILTCQNYLEKIASATLSKDGRKLCIRTDQRVVLYDRKTGRSKIVCVCENGVGVQSATFSQDGRQLCTRTSKLVSVVDQVTSKVVFFCQNGEDTESETLSQDGRQLCIITDERVVLYDLEKDSSKTVLTCQDPEERIWSATFSQDGRQLCIETSQRVVVYDHETGSSKTIFVCQNGERARSATFSEDRRQLCIATSQRVVIYDQETESSRTVFTSQNGEDVRSTTFSQDGRHLCIVTTQRVVIYDQETESSRTVFTSQNGERTRSSATFSQDGRQLRIATSQRVVVYDQVTGSSKIVFTSQNGERTRSSATFSQDERQLCIATNQRVVILPVLQNQLKDLDFEKVSLLLKASADWDKERAYELQGDELGVYSGLPDELKREELFDSSNLFNS